MRQSATNTPILMQDEPDSFISEAYRSLRMNIDFSVADSEVRSIAVMSMNRGEGKTITAVNLAASFAQAGKKVILIDTDLRKPAVHHAFGGDNSKGLSNLLSKGSTMHDIICGTRIDNLWVIPAGPLPSNPSELLASQEMNAVLAELKRQYEMIIIDSAPALSFMDAKLMAARCDGTLLVMEYGKLKRSIAKKLKEDLNHAKANLLGTVITKIKKKDAKTFFYR